jgi:hypothetical protein
MNITVSDHAMIRFIERVAGIDLTTFYDHIAGLVGEAVSAGATSVKIDGFLYVLEPKGMVVKTILDPHQAKRMAGFSGRHRMKAGKERAA